MTVTQRRLDDSTVLYGAPQSTVLVRTAGPHLVATRLRGHLDAEMAQSMIEFLDDVARAGPPTLFHDWSEMTGYDSKARSLLTNWQVRARGRFGPVHLLVTSRIVAMGVAVANVALGGTVKSTADRGAYEALARAAGVEPPAFDP